MVSVTVNRDDDVFGVRSAVVGEGTVFTSGEFAHFTHVTGDDVGNGLVVLVAGFGGLEVNIAVLRGAADYGRIRIEGLLAESFQRLFADHALERCLVEGFDLLYFMGCPESVEEVQERHAGLDGG